MIMNRVLIEYSRIREDFLNEIAPLLNLEEVQVSNLVRKYERIVG